MLPPRLVDEVQLWFSENESLCIATEIVTASSDILSIYSRCAARTLLMNFPLPSAPLVLFSRNVLKCRNWHAYLSLSIYVPPYLLHRFLSTRFDEVLTNGKSFSLPFQLWNFPDAIQLRLQSPRDILSAGYSKLNPRLHSNIYSGPKYTLCCRILD